MLIFPGIGLLLVCSAAFSARLPFDLDGLQGKSSKSDELEEQLQNQSYDYDQSTDYYDDSSPIDSRYEVPDSDSSEFEKDYDAALENVLEDIVETLQTHPELLKDLVFKNPKESNRPEAGKEIIDNNYPHTDTSEESRELDQYLSNIEQSEKNGPAINLQERGQSDSVLNTEEEEQYDPLINIQEGGQDDPMFDFERMKEPDDKQISETDNKADSEDARGTGQNSEQSQSPEPRTHMNEALKTDLKEKADIRLEERAPKTELMKSQPGEHSEDKANHASVESPKYRIQFDDMQ